MSKPVALITGASAGIGQALTREYARRGFRVVVLARRLDRLQQVTQELGDDALAIVCDVAQDDDLPRAATEALAKFGRIDVAIANAGISVQGEFDDVSIDDFRRVFETNVFGAIRTAKACLPALTESKGRFAIVSSVSAFVALPQMSVYSTSKFAARALAETLSIEWAALGVSVTHIAPGFVESDLRTTDNQGTHHAEWKDPVPQFLVMPAQTAARQMADAINARRAEFVVTAHGKLATAVARHLSGPVHAGLRFAGKRLKRTKGSK